MDVELDARKDAKQNAAGYFDKAKKMREKAHGALKAVEETKKKLAALETKEAEKEKKPAVRFKRQKEWFEKFRWFFSSDGFLVIAGKDATQNDMLYARHLEDSDLFLHADIQGAPAVVVKNGLNAPEKTLEEAAQWAASYSSAWKVGAGAVDVYAVKKGQLAKKVTGGFVGKGGFAISGERKWFKGTELSLLVGVGESGVVAAPEKCGKERFTQSVLLKPGEKEKGEVAKMLVKKFGVSLDELMQVLPTGNTRVKND